jgi:transcriptional regulator with XRE-family HTH domain
MNDIKILLGNRIKELRLEKELSQEKFALLVGIDRTYVQDIESGTRNISIVVIQKIALALGITISELLIDL